MSESERMPGYRNRSQVPPIASRASRIVKLLPGQRRAQVAGGADAGEPRADDQDVDVLERGSWLRARAR